MGNKKYLVRLIIEEIKPVNNDVPVYLGEVHGEDLMFYDDLSVAREAVKSYTGVIADYILAENSITDAGYYNDYGEWVTEVPHG